MHYVFKPGPETVWAIIVAVITVLAQSVQGGIPTDWKVWIIGVIAGLARAVLGVILSLLPSSEP